MDTPEPSTIPGETKLEPRQPTAASDSFFSGAVATSALAGILVGGLLGGLAGVLYATITGVGDTWIVIIGAVIGGMVLGGVVAGTQIAGRFADK